MRRIRNSHIFKQIFKSKVLDERFPTVVGRVHSYCNTSSAPHRIATSIDGLTKALLLLDPLIATSLEIMVIRGSEVEGKDAGEFLLFVSTPDMEVLVQAAMMSDGGDVVSCVSTTPNVWTLQ